MTNRLYSFLEQIISHNFVKKMIKVFLVLG